MKLPPPASDDGAVPAWIIPLFVGLEVVRAELTEVKGDMKEVRSEMAAARENTIPPKEHAQLMAMRDSWIVYRAVTVWGAAVSTPVGAWLLIQLISYVASHLHS